MFQNTTDNRNSAVQGARVRQLAGQVFRHGVQLAVTVGLIWIGVDTARSLRRIFPGESTRLEPTLVAVNPCLIPMAGSWSFAGSLWHVETSRMSLAEVNERLGGHSTARTPKNIEPMLEESLATLTASGGTLRIDEPQFKTRLQLDQAAIRQAMIAVPSSADQWQLVEVKASPNDQSFQPHLLPFQVPANRVCGRCSQNGELLMELVSVNTDRETLLCIWRKAGWKLRHTMWGSPNSFSFLCAKDGVVVYVWSPQTPQINSLLLSSSPDVAVPQANQEIGEDV